MKNGSIKRNLRPWGGVHLARVRPRGRGTSHRHTYGGVHTNQGFYMTSHLVELITMHGTAAPVSYSSGKGHGDMW